MTSKEKEFLLAEFNKAWDQLFHIDNRRGLFSRYFTVLFIAVVGISAKSVLDSEQVSILLATSLSIIFGFTIVAANTTISILKSERAANCRYRAKINLIREMFLVDSDDEGIKDKYLNKENEKIGIKLFTGVEQTSGDGGTLKGIYKLIRLESAALYILIAAVWICHFYSFLTNACS